MSLPPRKPAALIATDAGGATAVLLVVVPQGEAVRLPTAEAAAAVRTAVGAAGGKDGLQRDDVTKGANVRVAGQRQRTLKFRKINLELKGTLSYKTILLF